MPAKYQELRIWEESMVLAQEVYGLTNTFPREETYGLVAQMRRASVSIPSNIAEGYGRGGKDYDRFVGIAYGSLLELETQLELASRLGFVNPTKATTLLQETGRLGRMTNALRRGLQAKLNPPDPP